MKLTASDIHVELGGNEILKGIDAAIKEKEFVGIIGPNGSGKSTLLKCIYRVLKPDTGVIMLDGKPLNEYKVKDSAKALAVVSQHNYYNFEFSVQEIVMMGRAPHKKTMERDNAEDYKIVEECLEKVGMLPYRHRVFSSLSGGEQQLLAIMRGLMARPKLLMLDEPSMGLAPIMVEQVYETIMQIGQSGLTTLLVEQNTNMSLAVADYAYILSSGTIVKEGKSCELQRDENMIQSYFNGQS